MDRAQDKFFRVLAGIGLDVCLILSRGGGVGWGVHVRLGLKTCDLNKIPSENTMSQVTVSSCESIQGWEGYKFFEELQKNRRVAESLGCTIGKKESGGKDKRVVFIGGMGEGRRERG